MTGRLHQRLVVAALVAALLLAAQLLAAGHYHNFAPARQVFSSTPVAAQVDLCALCNLALHAPLELSNATSALVPSLQFQSPWPEELVPAPICPRSLAFSRAPPDRV